MASIRKRGCSWVTFAHSINRVKKPFAKVYPTCHIHFFPGDQFRPSRFDIQDLDQLSDREQNDVQKVMNKKAPWN